VDGHVFFLGTQESMTSGLIKQNDRNFKSPSPGV
jgi:hypothetical protein